ATAERLARVWQLGPGWGAHVTAERAMVTREGASVRGGAFGDVTVGSAAEFDAAVDACVQSVAARHQVTVAMPASGGAEATVDAAAVAEITGQFTGPDGVLATTARTMLAELGLSPEPEADEPDPDAPALARVRDELGADWMRQTAGDFDARTAVVLDDRGPSARAGLGRIAAGSDAEALKDANFTATGDAVAKQARAWAQRAHRDGRDDLADRFESIASAALDTTPGEYADDVAVVTG